MDRDILLFEKMNEIYDTKISFMIESLDTQMKINMLEAQYKVITESGTKEDFKYLYMEAKGETKEKKKSIFDGIIEWVKKIKDKIVDFFTKKKIEKEIDKLPNEFQIDEGYDKQFKGFEKFHKWLIKPINLFKQKKYKELNEDIIKKTCTIGIAASGVVIADAFVQCSKDSLKRRVNWIYNEMKNDCDGITEMCKKLEENAPLKVLRTIVAEVNKVISSALHWCIVVPSSILSRTALGVMVGGAVINGTAAAVKHIKNDINNS